MFLIVFQLFVASAIGFVDGELHAFSNGVGIHDDASVHVAGSTAGGLRQRTMTTQESFLVGIEDGHQRHFWQVETFAKQVDANEHIEQSGSQVGHDFHTVEGGHVGMNVVGPHIVVQEIRREFLGHALGKRGHQHALIAFGSDENLIEQVVDLVFARSHFNLWVEEARRSDDLLYDHAFRFHEFEVGRGCRDVDDLVSHLLKLLESQGAVVEGCRQAETILHKILLACAVAAIHRVQLRHRHVALVDDQEVVFWEEVEQAVGLLSGLSAVEVA